MRHYPERILLYQLVEEYHPAFKAHLAAQGTDLPGYVQQEFENHLIYGLIAKVPRKCRWRLTKQGWVSLGAAVSLKEETFPVLNAQASE